MPYLDPRSLIEKAQEGKIGPSGLDHLLKGLRSANPNSLAHLTLDYARRKPRPFLNSPIDVEVLKRISLAFHKKAGTDTPDVIRTIDNLADDTYRIRVAHQANLFPSLGVVSQIFLLNALAQQLIEQCDTPLSQLFVIVDYDIAQDQRFRVAHIPNVQAVNGSTSLSSTIPHHLLQGPMWIITKPSKETIEGWIKNFYMLTMQDLKSLRGAKIFEQKPGSIKENFEILRQIIWEAFDRADTLVEFNAFVLSQIVNIYWGMPTAFLFGRKLQSSMLPAYESLIEYWPVIATEAQGAIEFFDRHDVVIKPSIVKSLQEQLPIWITCTSKYKGETCNRRLPLHVTSDKYLWICSYCQRCGANYRFDLGTYSNVNLDPIRNHGISPRILADNLLDSLALGIAGGVGYIGQAEHMLMTNYIASRLDGGWEMPPHCLWRPKGFIYGLAEYRAVEVTWDYEAKDHLKKRALKTLELVYFGKASILYYLVNLGPQGLLKMWNDFFKQNYNVYTSNIASKSDISPLSLSDGLIKRLESYNDGLEKRKNI